MTNPNQSTAAPSQFRNPVRRFFWWCAGADHQLLAQCPNSEQMKYTAKGVIMLLIGLVAVCCFTVFLTLSFAVAGWKALPVGILWGVVALNLDRVLLTYARKGETLRQVWPRFVLAFALALLIGEPLLMGIFNGEIEAKLYADRQAAVTQTGNDKTAELQPQIAAKAKERDALQAQLEQPRQLRDDASKAMSEEENGLGGTKRVGAGPVYEAKRNAYERAKAAYDAESSKLEGPINALDQQINALQGQIEAAKQGKDGIEAQANGALARHKALFHIVTHNAGAAMVYVPLFATLLMLDLLPLLLTLKGRKGFYDYLLAEVDKQGMEVSELSSEASGATLKRVMHAVRDGQLSSLSVADERVLAEQVQQQTVLDIARAYFARRPVPAQIFAAGLELEVVGHPTLDARLQLPADADALTLDDLAGDLALLTETVADIEKRPVSLAQILTANGRQLLKHVPLLTQLGPDAKLILHFAPA